MVVELRENRLEKKRVRDKKDNKGATEYFGANLVHLLNLFQVTDAKEPPHLGVPGEGLKQPATLSDAEGLQQGRGGYVAARPDHCDTLLVEAGAHTRIQDGEPGQPDHGASPLRPRAAYIYGPEVTAHPDGLICHGCLCHGRTFPGGHENPLGTQRRNLTAKLFNGARAVALDSVDCWDLIWHRL